jgi:hypothetical protein
MSGLSDEPPLSSPYAVPERSWEIEGLMNLLVPRVERAP